MYFDASIFSILDIQEMFSCFWFYVWSVKIISLVLSRANEVGRPKVQDFERKPPSHLQAKCSPSVFQTGANTAEAD